MGIRTSPRPAPRREPRPPPHTTATRWLRNLIVPSMGHAVCSGNRSDPIGANPMTLARTSDPQAPLANTPRQAPADPVATELMSCVDGAYRVATLMTSDGAAAERAVEQAIRRELRRLGGRVSVDPVEVRIGLYRSLVHALDVASEAAAAASPDEHRVAAPGAEVANPDVASLTGDQVTGCLQVLPRVERLPVLLVSIEVFAPAQLA